MVSHCQDGFVTRRVPILQVYRARERLIPEYTAEEIEQWEAEVKAAQAESKSSKKEE